MRTELSSKLTPVYRWVIPLGLTVVAIAVVWRLARDGIAGRPDVLRVASGVALAAAVVVTARWFDRAKRVWIDDNALYVSDFREEIRVEWADVESVSGTRFIKPDRIRVRFRRATRFGDSIAFFPRVDWSRFRTPHRLVDDLSGRV